jgi:hypothetical protein
MNLRESKVADLVHWVRAEGAYCCGLDNVTDLAEKPAAIRVTMRCRYHDTYSFEVCYGSPESQTKDDEDSYLMRSIALGIVTNIVAR